MTQGSVLIQALIDLESHEERLPPAITHRPPSAGACVPGVPRAGQEQSDSDSVVILCTWNIKIGSIKHDMEKAVKFTEAANHWTDAPLQKYENGSSAQV